VVHETRRRHRSSGGTLSVRLRQYDGSVVPGSKSQLRCLNGEEPTLLEKAGMTGKEIFSLDEGDARDEKQSRLFLLYPL